MDDGLVDLRQINWYAIHVLCVMFCVHSIHDKTSRRNQL